MVLGGFSSQTLPGYVTDHTVKPLTLRRNSASYNSKQNVAKSV